MNLLRKLPLMLWLGGVVLAWPSADGIAQTSPAPGPTIPQPPDQPLAQSGRDLVVNPTMEECQKGWDPRSRWTREQFTQFCAKLKAAK
jgi:hypothetical protein